MSNEPVKGQGNGKGTSPAQPSPSTPAETPPVDLKAFAEQVAGAVSEKMEEKYQAQREKDQLAHEAEYKALKEEFEALKRMKVEAPPTAAAQTDKELLFGKIDPDNFLEPARMLFSPRFATVVTHKRYRGYDIPVPTPNGKPLEFNHMSTINSPGLNGETMQRLLSCAKIEHKDLWEFLTADGGCGFGTLYFDNPGLASKVDTGIMQRASRHLQSVMGMDSQQQLSELCHRYNISDPYNKDIMTLKMELAAAMAAEEVQGEMRLMDERDQQAQREVQLAMR